MAIQAKVVNLLPGMSISQVANPYVDNSFTDYVKNTFHQNYNYLQEIGASVSSTMQNLFSHFTSDAYVDKARNIAMEVGLKNDNTIHNVNCDNIYQSGFTMAGYVMANPYVWDMYSKFRVDGFNDMFTQSSTTEDPYLKTEYIQVMDDIVQHNDDGYEIHHYSHSAEDLTLREKLTVLDSWDCAEFLIENGIDPTSQTREEL